MTCIVGIADSGKVHIGGDSAGVDGYHRTIRADEKVFVNGSMAFGFTSSFRMGQLLRYRLTVPKQHDEELMSYMCGTFIDAVRQTLKDGGWLTTNSGEDHGGTFLVGYAGHLYRVDSDFQVGESVDRFDAIGCGSEYALGAMHAAVDAGMGSPLAVGLEAAARYSIGVAAPFAYVTAPA